MKSPLSYLPIASGLLVLILTLGVVVMNVTSGNQSVSTKAVEESAKLGLTPATGDYTLSSGTSYPVGIVLDSAGQEVDGVDVIINFDPTKVKVIDSKVTPTATFEQFPINTVDNIKGQVRFSALTFTQKAVTGVIGTFRFQPLVKGEINLSFQFTSGATTDSNIAGRAASKDILGQVENGRYTFK